MYGETFYGRHTAQHQLQWSQIKIRNFKYLTDKPNRNQNRIESVSGEESKGDIHIS